MKRSNVFFSSVLAVMLLCGRGAHAAHNRGAAAHQDKAVADAEFFPVAVWYGGGKWRAPMLSHTPARERAEWLHDLQIIHDTGFNSVKTWVDWATAEPREGEFHFEDLKQVLELSQQVGLRVIVQVYVDSAPDWVGRKYPDADFVSSAGIRIQSQSAPGYCFDHPGVHEAVLRFYRELARVANASPAFYGYDLWSEPHIVNWVWFNDLPNQSFCYCPNTRARFRDWLQRKYGSLAAMNASWYRTFQNWNEVDPPRFGTILSYADFMDWQQFIVDKLAEDLGAKAQAVRVYDPTHVTSSHSDVPSVLASPLDDYGMPDDWKMFQRVDYYGTSIYPKHAGSALHGWDPVRRAFAFDGAYSASRGKGFFIGELQTGQGATGLQINDPVEPSDIRDWAWSLVAHGAKAICFYAWYPMNAGYESNGYGFINLDGTVTARARAGGEVARVINNNAALFNRARPVHAAMAILYDRLAYLSGGNTVAPGEAVRDSLQGVYAALFAAGIPVEIIHADDLEHGGLKRYQAVYLPYAITLSRAAAVALADYVRRGGIAISEARLAWNDEHGFANERIPGAGLDEVFGVREASLWPAPKTSYSFGNDAGGTLAGLKVPAVQFEEALDVTRGRVLARFDDGQPAAVEATYGRGRTVFLGSFAGMAVAHAVQQLRRTTGQVPLPSQQMQAAGDAAKLIQALARWAGIEPPLRVGGNDAEDVEARLLDTGAEGRLLIAINRGPAGEFSVNNSQPIAQARDLLSNREVRTTGTSMLTLPLEREGTAVIQLK